MKLFTKIMAGVLLGIGAPIVLIAVVMAASPQSSDKEDAPAVLLFGLAPSALGGWLVFRGRSKSKQEEYDRLQATFFNLLKQSDGRITPLRFAMESGLTGELAKAYLDERAKEFSANFDVDENGDMFYRFNLGGLSLPDNGNSNVQPKANLPQRQRLVVGTPIAAQGNFDVILEAVPGVHKISAIKSVRELTGLGLKEAKDLVEATPTPLMIGIEYAIAQQCKKQLEAIGATVMVIEN